MVRSFGELKRWPSNESASTVVDPSFSNRTTRRPCASQTTSLPCASNNNPFGPPASWRKTSTFPEASRRLIPLLPVKYSIFEFRSHAGPSPAPILGCLTSSSPLRTETAKPKMQSNFIYNDNRQTGWRQKCQGGLESFI